jgi:TusA-related sulfurtransferase
MEPGRILEVVADDPVVLVDLPNWCSGCGHDYLGWAPGEGTEWRIFIQVGAGTCHDGAGSAG